MSNSRHCVSFIVKLTWHSLCQTHGMACHLLSNLPDTVCVQLKAWCVIYCQSYLTQSVSNSRHGVSFTVKLTWNSLCQTRGMACHLLSNLPDTVCVKLEKGCVIYCQTYLTQSVSNSKHSMSFTVKLTWHSLCQTRDRVCHLLSNLPDTVCVKLETGCVKDSQAVQLSNRKPP